MAVPWSARLLHMFYLCIICSASRVIAYRRLGLQHDPLCFFKGIQALVRRARGLPVDEEYLYRIACDVCYDFNERITYAMIISLDHILLSIRAYVFITSSLTIFILILYVEFMLKWRYHEAPDGYLVEPIERTIF